jgi:hypothetical protein
LSKIAPWGGFTLVFGLLGGCFASEIPCDTDQDCPEGMACSIGLAICVEPEEITQDPPGPSEGCNSVQVVRDDFEDGERGVPWGPVPDFVDSNVQVVEVGGALVFLPDEDPNNPVFGEYRTSFAYNLKNAAVAVHVPEVLNDLGNDTAVTYLDLYLDDNHLISMWVNRGEIGYLIRDGNQEYENAAPYVPESDVHWKISEFNDEVIFETSPDGEDWTQRWKAPLPSFAEAIHVILGVWATQHQTGLGQSKFEHVNMNLEPAQYCPTSVVREDFETASTDEIFAIQNWNVDECAAIVGNGVLTINAQVNTGQECRFETRHAYAVKDQSTLVELVSMPDLPNVQAGIFWWSAEQPQVDFVVDNQDEVWLFVRGELNPNNSESDPSPIPSPRWLSLSLDGTQLNAELSADGVSWSLFQGFSITEPFDAARIGVGIRGDGDLPGSTAGQAVFDNLGIPRGEAQ